ncbi:polymerase alpha-associated DNA helicase A [Seminavis robusta]|uniref:DNA helicase n=1 Tax=Seminavis robusta TaxID=568900 RepID=A0A9N8HH84_9STRA|nr:polymerase alpha-associated DNA helicase A [Seminavis robusta]|eukprot:Sro435_g142400.1 polymerase alpha-associated DNA helicase A (1060) ;mRNA; r:48911-52170
MTDSVIREFVRHQKELLELELNSEQDEVGVENGGSQRTVALSQLEASDISVGLYGRTVVQLTALKDSNSNNSSSLLPAHRFTVGDDVEIHSKQKKHAVTGGVISAVTDTSISVALFQQSIQNPKDNNKNNNKNNNKGGKDDNHHETEEDGLMGTLTLIPKSSVEVHKKLVAGLADLERHGPNHPIAGKLIQALFQPPTTTQPPPQQKEQQPPFNENLDASQLEAIAFCLEQERPVACIHGPPGTGKTTTVAELIQQAVHHHGMRVLVTAPSNVAVDNVLERLASKNSGPNPPKRKAKANNKNNNHNNKPLRMVRLGHPARIQPSILSYSLEALVQSHEGTEIVKDVRTELQSFLRILTNPKSRGNDKRMAYREVKSLRKEVRTREEKVVQELIQTAQVVLATTVGAASRLLRTITDPAKNNNNNNKCGFDLVIIDEAAQALEASCWIPILKGRKLVLAGDHCQLPPTIMCKHSKVQAGLGKTLFERLMKLYGDDGKKKAEQEEKRQPPKVSRMLKIQYRMHEKISNWASEASYHGELLTHESVRHRTIGQLVHAQQHTAADDDNGKDDDDDDVVSQVALLLMDTAGCGMHESESSSGSRFNEGEAQIVAHHVQVLLDKGLRQEQIAIITPYNGQVELLRTILLPDHPKLEIRSVDGFQGGEREAVVLSLVRSSDRSGGKKGDGIGFLRDNRRLNVAVTRAKRHCAVICDTETVSQSQFVKGLITWMEEHGEQRSALDILSGSNNDMNNDLRDAEIELQKAMAQLAKDEQKAKPSKPKEEEPRLSDDDGKRKEMLDKIAHFAEVGKLGEEMPLSTELTSFDRRVVHEFAEQIGLGHRSEGEGDKRRIILKIEKAQPVPPKVPETPKATEAETREPTLVPVKTSTAFAALAVDDDDDDSESDPEEESGAAEKKAVESNEAASNNLLADLARERQQREKEKQKTNAQAVSTTSSAKKKKNKKKGQKLGGKKPPPKNGKQDEDVGLGDLDDMAFLDKQIEKVQTSHGRQVFGKGNNYKTVINGILIAKPPPQEKEKNTRASSALQSKLKKAQGDRKAKTKKKG